MSFFTSIVLSAYFFFSLSGDIRKDFHSDESFPESHLEQIIESKDYPNTNLTLAYKGLCETMMANHVMLPTSKLSYFQKGKEKIEIAIKNEPQNYELRYVRLLVQLNAPSLLGYDENIESDFLIFKKLLKSPAYDNYWKRKFVRGLLGANYITDEKKSFLKQHLN